MRRAVELTLALAAVPGTHVLRHHHRCTALLLPSCTMSTSRPHCVLRSPSSPICHLYRGISERGQRSSTSLSRLMSRWAGSDESGTTTSRRGMGFDHQPVSTPLDQQLQQPEGARSSKQQTSWAKARREAQFDEVGEYRVYQDLLDGRKTRYVSRVMYDGTNYRGFQLQNNGQPTVQEVLERTLYQRCQTYVPVVAAGRTDSGVHAVGQAVHFDLPNANEDLAQLTYSMNQMMPADVRVWNMSVAPPASPSQVEQGLPWSSMLNAEGKVYTYRLFVGEVMNPLDRLYRAHASQAARAPVDIDRLYEAMPLLVGEHDFAGFSNEIDRRAAIRRAEGFEEYNTRRTVHSANIVDEGGGNIRLDFHLNGALYRMVRNMVGTLLAIAAGRMEEEVIQEIFRTGVRDSHGIYSAPAHGLTLETVRYDGYG